MDGRLLPWLLCLAALPPAAAQSAWLYGERHDHADHQRQTAADIRRLGTEGRLHAVVLEMAERGADTRGLPRDAAEDAVRAALRWNDAGWPWPRYREVVMNAVRAGVPVHGGNLAQARLREAMLQPHWDTAIPAEARARLLDAVRDGHCGLLPEARLVPMARMQIARDRSLAQVVAEAAAGAPADAVVVMLAGAMHASRASGVPLHLAALAPQLGIRSIGYASAYGETAEPGFDEWRPARPEPPQDHCAALRERGLPSVPASTSPTSR